MDAGRRGFLSGATRQLPLRPLIAERCLARQRVECRVCGEACEAQAIRFRPQLGGVGVPELLSQRCTGCGSCVAPCPVGAIAMQRDGVPA